MIRFLIALVCIAVIFTACTKEGNTIPEEFHSYQGITYGPDPSQVMDVYVPAHPTASYIPVMICIHGGGWYAGGKEDFDSLKIFDTLMHRGYAIVNINYRLAPAYQYPAPLDDIDSVIAALRMNVLKWGIDTGRICLFGKSSGAHLALQYAYTRRHSYIKAVIDCFGISDLTARQDMAPRLDTQIANFLGAKYIDNRALWEQASPMQLIGTAIPTVIFHGTADDVVYLSQSAWLKDALEQAGVPYKYVTWQGQGHGFTPATWQATAGISADWLYTYMF
jgi:acetyl esterase/lipase